MLFQSFSCFTAAKVGLSYSYSFHIAIMFCICLDKWKGDFVSSIRKQQASQSQLVIFVPVVKSRPCEDHGVVIGPFRCVAPAGSGTVPVVAPCWITNDTLWKALPHNKGKIHLWENKVKAEARGDKRREWEKKKGSEEIKTNVEQKEERGDDKMGRIKKKQLHHQTVASASSHKYHYKFFFRFASSLSHIMHSFECLRSIYSLKILTIVSLKQSM